MNSGNSKPSDPHRLLLNISDKINFKKSDKYVDLSNLSIYWAWINIYIYIYIYIYIKNTKTINLNISSNLE